MLEHHDHAFKRTHPLTDGHVDKYGIVYLGDGSWGKLRVPKTPAERPYLAATSGAYHMSVHRLEGDDRFHVALETSGKIADVCMTAGDAPGPLSRIEVSSPRAASSMGIANAKCRAVGSSRSAGLSPTKEYENNRRPSREVPSMR